MILIDYKDRRPIYEQIIEKFQQMILCGALQPGDAMPSVRSLAMDLSLNPNTIQRVYQELERAGYIYTMKGKGCFVSEIKEAAQSKRKELQQEFEACVKRAMSAGISKEELRTFLDKAMEMAERGERI
jgi:GntR family transcriptional regulator